MFCVEVLSIADYELARAKEMDALMDSAVDQLETLSRSGNALPKMTDLTIRFGHLGLAADNEPRQFEFHLPTTCATWPGPHFGAKSLHKVIAKPPKTAPKPAKQYCWPRVARKRAAPLKSAKAKKAKKSSPEPKILTSVASRDPPLHLLSLPAEIRNAFWTLLAVRKNPIEAQLRHIRTAKTPQKPRSQVVRRFPREPVVAAVNKQLRREVLSIFYGTNQFVMEKNACDLYKNLSMTHPGSVQKWSPRPDLANFLSSVDLRYHVMPRPLPYGMGSVVYTLRRLADGRVTIDVKAEWPGGGKKGPEALEACLCKEIDTVGAVRDSMQGKDTDLAQVSLAVMRKRLETIFGDPSIEKTPNHHPGEVTCSRCKKDTFEIVYSGL
ncbi:uncharacterized protein MYCFIDRAFT_199457 [Pseudocercospora fijiensis CIRAD86]|uniref:Uncharacterized protein n=1 Tax=Pseudocercospora fijiensis (strain CIRAD86) TaxID=383855 RepID=M3AQW5_PSEFD|nr:uncharacterized protein MYCFIDRAFT_199457 [Pseudocercospora fijiensis CIRAD86]EME79802.1 hypothetical protein MYCFIDRAFT_199457 [Pseudocercospora fijiensis CIRAD86]